MKTLALILALGCAVAPQESEEELSMRLNEMMAIKSRQRIVGPRKPGIPATPEFNVNQISHPAGGWSVGFVLNKAYVEKVSDLVWKVQIKTVVSAIDRAQYPRTTNGLLDVAVFRMRHDSTNNWRRQECLTQVLRGVSFEPGTVAEFVLDMNKFTNPLDIIMFEHYAGYGVHLSVYMPDGTMRPLNGNEGVFAGPTPYIPERMQSLTALIGCD